MRITNSMFYNDMQQNIQQNLQPMLTTEEQLSTGYKMNQPSDDPADLGTVMSLSSIMAQNNSEASVVTIQQGRLSEADSSLGQATQILDRAQTLVEEANNSSMTGADTADMATEVKQLLQEMVDVANQTRGTGPGETFFTLSGTTVSNSGAPDVSPGTLSHDTVDPNAVYYDNNVKTTGAGGTPVTTSVFAVLQNVYNDLQNNPGNQNTTNGTFSTDIQQLSDAASWIIANRAQVGAVEDRLQSLQTQITNQNLSLTQLMAGFKDTNVEKATVQFNQEQATYQAAMETSAAMMKISLTNYLQL